MEGTAGAKHGNYVERTPNEKYLFFRVIQIQQLFLGNININMK
jgi:hypothetical protein